MKIPHTYHLQANDLETLKFCKTLNLILNLNPKLDSKVQDWSSRLLGGGGGGEPAAATPSATRDVLYRPYAPSYKQKSTSIV